MLVIALTGSLATGKSTVSRLLSQPPYSLPIIDADLLAREVVEPGTTGYDKIVKYFGPSTPDLLLLPTDSSTPSASEDANDDAKETSGGERGRGRPPLNRAALGRRVFGSSPSRVRDRKVLNSIIHPLVRRAMLSALLYHHFINRQWACVLDIPLLYESGLDVLAGVVVMVGVRDPQVQMQRLRARDKGLSAEEARDRVGSQMPVQDKVERTLARGERRGKVVWKDGGR